MSFELVEGINVLKLDIIMTATLAAILLMLGYAIRRKIKVLENLAIPAPVIGGFLFAIVTLLCRTTGAMQFELDTALQLPFMLIFFTCVGFGGSIKLLKSGGKLLLIFLCLCWGLSLLQNAVGVGLATALGIDPILGIMAGSVSLVGGHGNAAAFGPQAEALGAQGATAVAVAAATFGLVAGNLLGGPVGDFLIRKNKVQPVPETDDVEVSEETGADVTVAKESIDKVTPYKVVSHLAMVFVFMGLGLIIGKLIDLLEIPNFALPSYVGAMFVAIIFRNLNDKFSFYKLNLKVINYLLEVGLSFFLTMAVMNLKIWELADLALPLIVILIVQTILVILITVFVAFKVLGKDYDAGVMSGGYMGWGVGISATAVACMGSICEKYRKTSTKAFMIVPLSGAVFVDIVAIPGILMFMKWFAG